MEGPSRSDLLLVVPDRRLRAFLLAQLQEEGYRVVAVPTVRHARLVLWQGISPRLVVLDLADLREPDEALQRLLAEASAPVLAAAGAVDRERAQRLGVTEVIARPFTVAQLVARVRALAGPPDQ